MRKIDGLVQEVLSRKGGDVSPQEAAEFVFERLGLPRAA